MAKYAKVEAGHIVSIGQCADTEIITQDVTGEEVRERVAVIPVGCVAVSDAEYTSMQSDPPDAAIIAAVIERGA